MEKDSKTASDIIETELPKLQDIYATCCRRKALSIIEDTSHPAHDTNCTCSATNSRCDDNAVCRCDPGWEGEQCELCVRKPGCVHGSCHQPWQCICEADWTGRFCDKDIHVCSKEEPCQNGGTCVTEDSGEYICLCVLGFHGRNCQMKTGPCHQRRSPCRNGGLCEDNGGFASELTCRCLAGFTGPRCETDMDDCLMKPCANGATCLDGVNRFSCLCPKGFMGRFCTVNLDDCISQPCLNGGRCLDRAGTFQCLCQPGYTGTMCEVAVWSSQSWKGDDMVSKTNHDRQDTTSSSTSSVSTSSTTSNGGNRLFKISVKEVVTRQGSAGLSEVQLITVLVLGGMTMTVVALTVGLVLRGRCKDHGVPCPCGLPLSQQRQRRLAQNRLAQGEPECKISFLHTESEPQKKRLNTEVI
ncbi:protein delta homolog 2 [Lampris incognitus]|uniref:protein delta homolog 2 n=1 Tax=Lampris incognitus TaxID=2546036 RepID=UPI0024B534F1|nr:protein delta homolog 2 [Lampris incognitus]